MQLTDFSGSDMSTDMKFTVDIHTKALRSLGLSLDWESEHAAQVHN